MTKELTPAEVQTLSTMLDRTSLATILAALAHLCIERANKSRLNNDSTSARHWEEMFINLSMEDRRARNKFGA